METSLPANNHVVGNKFILALMHTTYALNLLSFLFGILSLIATVVLYITSTNIFIKNHLRYLLRLNIIIYAVGIGSWLILLLYGGSVNRLPLNFGISSLVETAISAPDSLGVSFFVLMGALLLINIIVGIWFFIKTLLGWIAFFRKRTVA